MFSLTLNLFPVERIVPEEPAVVYARNAKGDVIVQTIPQWRTVRIPSLRVELGRQCYRRMFGITVAWGVVPQVGVDEGLNIYLRQWVWAPIHSAEFAAHPWLWWSPVKPLWRHTSGLQVGWTGRGKEVIGLFLGYGRRTRLHWLRSPI